MTLRGRWNIAGSVGFEPKSQTAVPLLIGGTTEVDNACVFVQPKVAMHPSCILPISTVIMAVRVATIGEGVDRIFILLVISIGITPAPGHVLEAM